MPRKKQIRKREQRLWGVGFLAISIVGVILASHGITPADRDCTAALLAAPLGLYLIFTRKVVL